MDADYTLLRVVHPVMPPLGQGPAFFQGMQALVEAAGKVQMQVADKARTYLEGVADRVRGRPIDVRVRVSVAEQPASAILEMVTSGNFDLVAMETHGRKGLARLFLGSVADKVLRGSAVPLLLHRPVEL